MKQRRLNVVVKCIYLPQNQNSTLKFFVYLQIGNKKKDGGTKIFTAILKWQKI